MGCIMKFWKNKMFFCIFIHFFSSDITEVKDGCFDLMVLSVIALESWPNPKNNLWLWAFILTLSIRSENQTIIYIPLYVSMYV